MIKTKITFPTIIHKQLRVVQNFKEKKKPSKTGVVIYATLKIIKKNLKHKVQAKSITSSIMLNNIFYRNFKQQNAFVPNYS